MAYNYPLPWTAALLVAGTLACSSGSPSQSTPTCPTGTTDCNGVCANTQVDSNNCGGCGKACTGSTSLCSNGACSASCPSGQSQCGNNCVDTKSDHDHCGNCSTTCSSSQTCSNSSCVNTGNGGSTGVGGASTGGSGQGGASASQGGSATGGASTSQGGSATGGAQNRGGSANGGSATGGAQSQGGSSVGGAATGGAQNQGGSSVGGGSAGTPTELSCTDALYGTVNIPAINIISDFENGTLFQYVQDGRGANADAWHAYAFDDTNENGEMKTPGAHNPKNSANSFKVDTTVHGPCRTSGGSLHVSSPGPATSSDYVGFGIDFMARTTAVPRKKNVYDASKYTGVGFWAKCSKDLEFAFFKTVDGNQDADVNPAPCSYSADPKCNQYGIKNAAITTQWSYYKLYFSEMLQDPNGSNFTTGVTANKLTAFQIHVNPFSTRGGSPTANPFDCYIDDVHFLSEAAPTVPAATVTWTTSGNKLMRNGTAYRMKGLDRPSMEWDCAGFSITREDIKRMKTWKSNTVRLAVKETLWNGATTGGSTCNGDAYKRQVKRVINWILQEGMDAILDLHDIDGVPGSAHTAFWTAITGDTFFKDNRIIFELYNEPNGAISSIQSWMQSTVDLIRNKGYTNLLLVAGTDWTFDISAYENAPITGANAQPIAYVAHPYDIKPGGSSAWDGKFGNVAKKFPVIATEFGQTDVSGGPATPTQKTCDGSFYNSLLTYFADSTRSMGYTGWAWYVDHYNGTVSAESTCGFPQLIVDYSATTNSAGAAVKTDMAK